MAQTKQTQRKQPDKQGSPAKFPKKGKPTGKAAKHMEAASDDNNNTVQGTIRAGRRRRARSGKARIYKRPVGLKRKYRPGVGALQEIRHYQRGYGTICSKIACARLFREICENEKKGITLAGQCYYGAAGRIRGLSHRTVSGHGTCGHPRKEEKLSCRKTLHLVRQLCQETDPYAGSISLRDLKKKNRKGEQDFDEFGNVIY